MQEHLHRSLA